MVPEAKAYLSPWACGFGTLPWWNATPRLTLICRVTRKSMPTSQHSALPRLTAMSRKKGAQSALVRWNEDRRDGAGRDPVKRKRSGTRLPKLC